MKTEKGSITFEFDEFSDAPWDSSDYHGPVRKSDNAHNKWDSDKRPGERPLNSANPNEYQFYYDWQKAMQTAKHEGWNTAPYDAPNKALRAVQQDFDYLRGWVNNKWYYVFVTVEYEGETESLGGVETYNDYHIECANEMLADLIARVEKEKTDREYWNSLDICTV
jgi:hypothetical protein